MAVEAQVRVLGTVVAVEAQASFVLWLGAVEAQLSFVVWLALGCHGVAVTVQIEGKSLCWRFVERLIGTCSFLDRT